NGIPLGTRKNAPIRSRKQREKAALAYRALAVTEDAVARMPQVTPQLRAILPFIKELAGDPPDLLVLLSLSEDPDARKFLATVETVPEDSRDLLPIEAYCAGAGISP